MVLIEYNTKGLDSFIDDLSSFLEKQAGTRGRPRLFTCRELLTVVITHIHYGIPWRHFKGLKANWSTYFKRWSKICKAKLIEEFFQNSIKRFKASGLIKDSKSLIIDSTTVRNLLGSELVSKDPATGWKHKGTKLHLIATQRGIPLGVTFSDALTHDVKMVSATIETIPISTKRAKLLGDKGYISKDLKKKLKAQQISFIYPHRKNMRPVSKSVKRQLRNRKFIEHNFSILKRHRNVSERSERKLYTFKSVCYFTLGIHLFAKVKN